MLCVNVCQWSLNFVGVDIFVVQLAADNVSRQSEGRSQVITRMGARITQKTQESYRARGMEAEWQYGIECPLALPSWIYVG